jgi:DNA-binding MarR family transcriptional regulator
MQLATAIEDAFTDLARVLLPAGGDELSRTAASVLSWLDREGARRVTDLAAHQAVAQPTMTALIGRLEARGLVARGPDPDDARATRITITPAGRAALHERRERRAAHVAQRLEALTPSERAALAAALPALHRLASLED